MRNLRRPSWTLAAWLAVWLQTGSLSWASGLAVDIIPNFVGLGVGTTTQWMGSSDMVGGIVPGGWVQLSNHRFAEMYGAIIDANVDVAWGPEETAFYIQVGNAWW